MFLKTLGIVAPVVAGGVYMMGWANAGYSRDVDRPPEEVMAALADLDIREQPGAPGSDPSASGGVAPLFVLDRGPSSMSWKVMSGDKVATVMTASIVPLDGGRRSRVTARVERGDAPDDFVSPAFRSEGLTLGLFGMALESELNELTLPAGGNPEKCAAMIEDFRTAGHNSGTAARPTNMADAVGGVAKISMRLAAFEAEMRRNGCNPDDLDGVAPATSRMESPDTPSGGDAEGPSDGWGTDTRD